MSPVTDAARRLVARIRRAVAERRARRLVLEGWDGLTLLVLPDVQNPLVFRTGTLLAAAVARRLRTRGAGPHGTMRVLDAGCGTGIVSLAAAREGAVAVAIDLSPQAVRNACINALLNRLEERIDVRGGDLFAPAGSVVFDLVAFNPPLLRGKPKDLYDLAFRSEDVLERFCAALPAALAPGGEALVVLSGGADEAERRRLLAGSAFELTDLSRHELGEETATIVLARRAPPPSGKPAG